MRYLLDDLSSKHDLGTTQLTATSLWVDNESAKKMANNGKPSGRSRHIDIQYYAVQEWVKRKIVVIRRVCTKENVSDALTKILGWVLHGRHCDEMMGYNGPKYWLFSTVNSTSAN